MFLQRLREPQHNLHAEGKTGVGQSIAQSYYIFTPGKLLHIES
jgi:hypothetical protein